MNPGDQAWQKLISAARGARDDRSDAAPFGFSTRVVAFAWENPRAGITTSLFERWSWRALTIAGMFAAVTMAANYASVKPAVDEELLSDEPMVASLLDRS
jgi:hypothetical protein